MLLIVFVCSFHGVGTQLRHLGRGPDESGEPPRGSTPFYSGASSRCFEPLRGLSVVEGEGDVTYMTARTSMYVAPVVCAGCADNFGVAVLAQLVLVYTCSCATCC